MTYDITENFISWRCKSGLLQAKDRVTLDIKVTVTGEAPTDDTSLVLEVVDPVDNFTITMCNLRFKLGCSLKIAQGCFCVNVTDNVYFFRYHSAANKLFRNGQLMVNGEVIPGVKFPEIYTDNPPVCVKVDGQKSMVMDRDCHVKAATHKNVSFTICVAGLLNPLMYMAYGADSLTINTTECITAYFKVLDKTEKIDFQYLEHCGRLGQHVCLVQALEESYLKNESDWLTTPLMTTSTRVGQIDDGDHFIRYLLTIILIVTFLSSVYIAYKLKHKRRERLRSSEHRQTSLMEVISTPVDLVAPKTSSSRGSLFPVRKTLRSLTPSILRRTTLKKDQHLGSTEV